MPKSTTKTWLTDIKVTYQAFDEHNNDLVAGRLDAVVGDSLAFSDFPEFGCRQGFRNQGLSER